MEGLEYSTGLGDVRITEKRRDATAAAAIVQRIVNLRIPLVFLAVLPLKAASVIAAVIVVVDEREGCRQKNEAASHTVSCSSFRVLKLARCRGSLALTPQRRESSWVSLLMIKA